PRMGGRGSDAVSGYNLPMCGRYVLVENLAHLVEHELEEPPGEWDPRYNVAPTQKMPILRRSEEADTWRVDHFQWGLVPFWSKEAKVKQNLFNARSETAAEKPSFRAAFKKRRCLIPATGFYEWAGPKGDRTTYFIQRMDEKPLIFAGLWESWDADGRATPLRTFTILTTAANQEMSEFHHRMPVVLDPEGQELWMQPEVQDIPALQNLMRPLPDGSLKVRRVGTWVNKATNEGPDCLSPPDNLLF
ncbi:MAG: SOS response-associated peptidase, partial [Planctomycetota bacterium]|nr:SOS response-associated peptidase [Planctomycetota bacterium]